MKLTTRHQPQKNSINCKCQLLLLLLVLVVQYYYCGIIVVVHSFTILSNYNNYNNNRRYDTNNNINVQQDNDSCQLPLMIKGLSLRTTTTRRRLKTLAKSSLSLSNTNNNNNNNNKIDDYTLLSKLPKQQQKNSNNGQFEYQELIILLSAINQQQQQNNNNINFRSIPKQKQNEIVQYIQAIININYQSKSTVSSLYNTINTITSKEEQQQAWKLLFSTESLIVNDLPAGATIVLNFNTTASTSTSTSTSTTIDNDTNEQFEYILQFNTKGYGLQNIKALCTYSVSDDCNTVYYKYDTITTDIFNCKNINLGFLSSMILGKTNQLNIKYYDNTILIEEKYDPATSNEVMYNVYYKTSI